MLSVVGNNSHSGIDRFRGNQLCAKGTNIRDILKIEELYRTHTKMKLNVSIGCNMICF